MTGISIIIPVFNAGFYLSECLDSIARQCYPIFEAIVINDGSTDITTLEILNRYASNERFKIINSSNGGVSNARNIGIKAAKYDLITFIDSDDTVSSDYLKTLYCDLVETNSDISIIGVRKFYGKEYLDSTESGSSSYEYNRVILNGDEATLQLLLNKITGYACGKLFRKKVISSICFNTKLKIMEDYCFVNLAFINSFSVSYNPRCLYFYRIHTNSATQVVKKDKMLSIHEAIKLIIKNNKVELIGKSKGAIINAEVSMLAVLAYNNMLDVRTFKNSKGLINSIKKITKDKVVFPKKILFIRYRILALGRVIFILLCKIAHFLFKRRKAIQ